MVLWVVVLNFFFLFIFITQLTGMKVLLKFLRNFHWIQSTNYLCGVNILVLNELLPEILLWALEWYHLFKYFLNLGIKSNNFNSCMLLQAITYHFIKSAISLSKEISHMSYAMLYFLLRSVNLLGAPIIIFYPRPCW